MMNSSEFKQHKEREEAILNNKSKSNVKLLGPLFIKMCSNKITKQEFLDEAEKAGIEMTELREYYGIEKNELG